MSPSLLRDGHGEAGGFSFSDRTIAKNAIPIDIEYVFEMDRQDSENTGIMEVAVLPS